MNANQFALIVSCEARILPPNAPPAKRASAKVLVPSADFALMLALCPPVVR